jgi:hypothetical protein
MKSDMTGKNTNWFLDYGHSWLVSDVPVVLPAVGNPNESTPLYVKVLLLKFAIK